MTAVALFVGVAALVWLIVADHAARRPKFIDWDAGGWID